MSYKFEELNDEEEVRKYPIVVPIEGFDDYEVDTDGNIYNSLGKRLKPGLGNHGYLLVGLMKNGKQHTKNVHRLVAQTFIDNPNDKDCVDHIDNDKTNNSVYNLRWATHQENHYNRSISSNNTSGVKGVTWNRRAKKWQSQIMINGKLYNLGYFDDIEDAKRVRQLKAQQFFGLYINKIEIYNN